MVHALIGAELSEWETDRLRFIGRNHRAIDPIALEQRQGLSGMVGNVLDGCFSLRTRVEIPAGGAVECAFLLGIAKERAETVALVDHWRSGGVLEKRFQQEDNFPRWRFEHDRHGVPLGKARQRMAESVEWIWRDSTAMAGSPQTARNM